MQVDALSNEMVLYPANNSEFNFIKQSYVRSNRRLGINSLIEKAHYFNRHTLLINAIIHLEKYLVKVLKHKDNDLIIVGYVIYKLDESGTTFFYIFIKQDYRGLGLATFIINSLVDSDHLVVENLPDRKRNKSSNRFAGLDLIYKPKILFMREKNGSY